MPTATWNQLTNHVQVWQRRSFFWSSQRKKKQVRKNGLRCSRFQSQLLLVKSASAWNKRFNTFATMKGPKLDPPGGTTFDFKRSTFWPLFKHVSFGSKTGPSTGWIRCLLGGAVFSPPNHLLRLRCSNVEAHQRHTKTPRCNKNLKQGRFQLVSKNHISFRCQKRTQKLASCTSLSWSWQSFPFCYVDERGPVREPKTQSMISRTNTCNTARFEPPFARDNKHKKICQFMWLYLTYLLFDSHSLRVKSAEETRFQV